MYELTSLASLRERSFILYSGSRFLSGNGNTLHQALIAWQVYSLTGSALQLGLLGVARFVPALAVSLLGGAIADTYDRRKVIIAAQVLPILFSLLLAVLTYTNLVNTPFIYLNVVMIGLANSFENPARQALLPQIVPREVFGKAVTSSTTIQQLSLALGPALAGVAIANVGIGGTYLLHVLLMVCSVCALIPVETKYGAVARGRVTLALIKEGMRFVKQRSVLWGIMTLDMFAVMLGSAQAMLPIYAQDILKVGPEGYGLLASALAWGAFLSAFAILFIPQIQHTGRAILFAVGGFGVFTIIFGLSTNFWFSMLAYGLVGAIDQVSAVMRQVTIQLATPDALRGRVSSVNMIFIGASNHLGGMESGLVAAVTNATFSVVSGGVGCLLVLGVIAAKVPALWNYHVTRNAEAEEANSVAAQP